MVELVTSAQCCWVSDTAIAFWQFLMESTLVSLVNSTSWKIIHKSDDKSTHQPTKSYWRAPFTACYIFYTHTDSNSRVIFQTFLGLIFILETFKEPIKYTFTFIFTWIFIIFSSFRAHSITVSHDDFWGLSDKKIFQFSEGITQIFLGSNAPDKKVQWKKLLVSSPRQMLPRDLSLKERKKSPKLEAE